MKEPSQHRRRRGTALAAALVTAIGLSLVAASPAWAFRNGNADNFKQNFTQVNSASVVGMWSGSNAHVFGDSGYGAMGANQSVGPSAAQFEGFGGTLPQANGYFTDAVGCSRGEANSLCTDRGQITVTFDRAVTDPLLNVAGLGEGVSFPSGSTTVFSTVLDIATPGVTFTGLSSTASNLELVGDTRLQAATNRPNSNCTAAFSSSYDGKAGCGSVKLSGTFTSVTFNVSLSISTDAIKHGAYTTSHRDKIYMNVTLQDQPAPVAQPITLTGRYSEAFPAQKLAEHVVPATDPGSGQPIPLDPASVKFSLNGSSGWASSLTASSGTAGIDARGVFSTDAQGAIVFTPTPGYVGTRTVHYQVKDIAGTTTTGTLLVNVTGPPFECTNTIYMAGSSTGIHAIDLSGFADSGSPISSPTFLARTSYTNGLGIANGGKTAYWREGNSIVQYTADAVPALRVFPGFGQDQLGGVNPVNGLYYYGTDGSSAKLYAFDPALGESFQVGVTPVGLGSYGDLAFTAAGDLAILGGSVVILIPAEYVPDTEGTAVLSHGVVLGSKFPGGSDGIAYGSDGLLYTDDSGAISQSDPNSGSVMKTLKVTSGRGTDLGSCAEPSTIKLQKDVQGRVKATDQFTLKLQADGATPQTATTQGSKDGLQPEAVGTRPVTAGPNFGTPGKKYTLSETGAAGANLALYNSRYECVDKAHDDELIASGSGASFSLTYPSGTGREVVCTFFNKPIVSEIALTKVDKSNPNTKLGGAKFQLWKDVNGNGTLEPAVDTKVGAEQTSDVSGSIRWNDNLTAGKYLLEETAAPDGYEIAARVTAVTVGNDTATVTIENARSLGSVTWGKTDNTGNYLKGSVWTLTGPSGSSSPDQVVADCVGDAPADCAGQLDQDPRPGRFEIKKLDWGDYTLKEKTAPTGYVLSSEVHSFTVGSPNDLAVDLGDYVNQQQPALVIPLTGGLGKDHFLLAGGGLAALLLAAFIVRRRRNRSALRAS